MSREPERNAHPDRPVRRRPPAVRRAFVGVALVAAALVLFGIGAVLVYVMLGQPKRPAAPAAQAIPAAPAGRTDASAAAAPPSANALETTVEDIGDWVLVCPSDRAAAACFIQQRLATATGATALRWTIFADAQGTMRAVWQTPRDVDTSTGMALDLGDGQPRRVPFDGCDASFCSARAILAPAFLAELKAAASLAALVRTPASPQPVRYQLSARGLPEALARL